MKRKFKLFATIASLCLSVALMAFGVYAATSATYEVSSTVTYESQLNVVWNGQYQIKTAADANYGDPVSDSTHNVIPTDLNGSEAATATWNVDGDSEAEGVQAIALTAANPKVVYTFTCLHNGGEGADDIYVYVTGENFFADQNLSVSYVATSNAAAGNLSAVTNKAAMTADNTEIKLETGKTYTFTITVALVNTSRTVASNNAMDITLHAVKASAKTNP